MSVAKRHGLAAGVVASLQAVALALSGAWTGSTFSVLACSVSAIAAGAIVFGILEAYRQRCEMHPVNRAAPVPKSARSTQRAAEVELRRALYNIRNLLAVSVDLNAVGSLDELCRTLTLHFLGLMRVTKVAIFLPQEHGDIFLRHRYGRGVMNHELQAIPFDLSRAEVLSLLDSDRPVILSGTGRFETQLVRQGFRLLAP